MQNDALGKFDPPAVRKFTEVAIKYRGQPRGLAALEKLGEQCAFRTPYDLLLQQAGK